MRGKTVSIAQTHRTETDSIGPMILARDAVHGIQTARALENFPITGVGLNHFPALVNALAWVKSACARANVELGVLDADRGRVIVEVCGEILEGRHHEHFVVDVIQGGAGTSTNMNANEVIANIGLQRMGFDFGDYARLHPNDHVNRSQSTNDVYPTAIRCAILTRIDGLCDALSELQAAFDNRASAFDSVAKIGRTQLQDAVPMSLGMEFASFAVTVGEDIDRIREVGHLLREVNLGGTAIGTGVNAPPGYGAVAVRHLRQVTGIEFVQAANLIEASSDLGAFVTFSGILKRVAVKLSKICNDLRLLSSGPRGGIGEISLPAVQAGSSIMPGKVNPVIAESVTMVCAQVIGNDVTITVGGQAANFELIVMLPVMAYNLLQSIELLATASTNFAVKCIAGIKANEERCKSLIEESLAMCTALAPVIGYEAAAKLAKDAYKSGKTVREVAREQNVLPEKRLNQLLDPWRMTQAGGPVGSAGG